MRGHHFGVPLLVLIVALMWVGISTPQPLSEVRIDIGEPQVIYADEPVTPSPSDPASFRNPDLQRAMDYLDLLVHHWYTPPYMEEERRMIDDALANRPERVQRTASRSPAYVTPAHIQELVERYFLIEDVDKAIRVIWCESRFDSNAKNPTSTASGLAQHLKGWWSGDWGVTGAFDPFDPEQSVKAMAALVYHTKSGWGNWYPSQHCWG